MITPFLQRTSLVTLALLLGCSEDIPGEPNTRAPTTHAPVAPVPATPDNQPVAAPGYNLNPAYLSLREKALGIDVTTLDVPADTAVFTLLMETGSIDYAYTLELGAVGSTSLYFSNGGGTVGAGAFNGIDDSTRRVIDLSVRYLHLMTDSNAQQLPTPGSVHLHVRTPAGWKTLEAPEAMLVSDKHPASELYHACQNVISEVLDIGN